MPSAASAGPSEPRIDSGPVRRFLDPSYVPLCATLAQVRSNIDRIDRAIVALLAERGAYVKDAARFKRDSHQVAAPQRQAEVCVPPVAVIPQAKAGRIKALAVTGAERSSLLPDLPTVKEAGFPEIQALAWMAYMAPAATPPDIVARMSRELVATLKEPDTRQKLQAAYMDPVGNSPGELAAFMQDELARWTPAIKRSGAMEQ